jgi:hypothetical protein
LPKEKIHLKSVTELLGWKPNIFVHRLLDGGNLPKRIRLIYHRTTHSPEFIDRNIKPPDFSDRDNLEAYFHIFQDIGIAPVPQAKKAKTIKNKNKEIKKSLLESE